jgi:nucleoside-diphosphate-sugar epimerase
MKILIAGCGWLGSTLAERLRISGHDVTGTRRSPDAAKNGLIAFHPGRSASDEAKRIFSEADAAVIAFPPDRTSRTAYANDCLETISLLSEKCMVVLVSSTGAYSLANAPEQETEVGSEPSDPLLLAEFRLREKLGGRLTIIRMAGLAGEGRSPVRSMSASGKTYNGSEPVNLIHRRDAAGTIAFVIESALWGEVFDACAAEHPLKSDYYSRMAEKLGIAAPKFEDGPAGRIIRAEKLRARGYVYEMNDPYGFD